MKLNFDIDFIFDEIFNDKDNEIVSHLISDYECGDHLPDDRPVGA